MNEEYPLFPELSEEGENEAQKLMDGFKVKLAALCDDVLGELYCDVAVHIESDSWTNYRNKLMEGFTYYPNRHKQGEHDFKQIRHAILKEHSPEIIADLNKDLLDEVAALKTQIQWLQNNR